MTDPTRFRVRMVTLDRDLDMVSEDTTVLTHKELVDRITAWTLVADATSMNNDGFQAVWTFFGGLAPFTYIYVTPEVNSD